MRVCSCTGAIYIQCGGSPRVLGERGLCKSPLNGLDLRLAPYAISYTLYAICYTLYAIRYRQYAVWRAWRAWSVWRVWRVWRAWRRVALRGVVKPRSACHELLAAPRSRTASCASRLAAMLCRAAEHMCWSWLPALNDCSCRCRCR